jgi:hypothetical protein
MAEALPVSLGRASGDTGAPALMLAARPTAAGRAHAALRLRDDDAASAARWDSLPVVSSVNRLGALRSGATTLLIGHVNGTDAAADVPLLAFQRYGRGMGVVFGVQDSWLWQMDPTTPITDATHAIFWRQLLRWTVEGVPDQVDVVATPGRVGPGDPVTLRAHVADSAFVPVNDARVVARVTTPTGAIVEVPMERGRDEGAYQARYVPPERGTYALSAVARVGRDSTRSAPGALLADDQGADVEQAELRTPLLRRIADETGGRYYPLADANRLIDDVSYTESGVTQRDARDLWDAPAVFLALVLLLGTEWAWRRRQGLG